MSARRVNGQEQRGDDDRAVAVQSVEDPTGIRCVDIRAVGAGFDWVTCRRDPEDGHGWRVIAQATRSFDTKKAARADAAVATEWFHAAEQENAT